MIVRAALPMDSPYLITDPPLEIFRRAILWPKGISSTTSTFLPFVNLRSVPGLIGDVAVATLSFRWLRIVFFKVLDFISIYGSSPN